MEEFTNLYQEKSFIIEEKQASRVLKYYWLSPVSPYAEDSKFPLVLILHGTTGKSYAGKYLAQPDMQAKYPAFIMVPALAKEKTWTFPDNFNVPDHMKWLLKLESSLPDIVLIIESLLKDYPIDRQRIYVIGCSEGGFGAFGAARYYPDLFAAAISISGGWDKNDAASLINTPIWAIHGNRDEIVPPYLSRTIVESIQELGGTATYTAIPTMKHQCPLPELYDSETWDWLFAQKK